MAAKNDLHKKTIDFRPSFGDFRKFIQILANKSSLVRRGGWFFCFNTNPARDSLILKKIEKYEAKELRPRIALGESKTQMMKK